MRHLIALVLALFVGAAVAQQSVGSIRVQNRILSTGDSTASVARLLGDPDHIVTLEGHRGQAVGQRWEYWDVRMGAQSVSLAIVMQAGRVAHIERDFQR